ncbi:cytochrome P450 family protein [Saccharothrix obliqua]|uniref:cytochrome P450 family protein n=1 Tax=Saccharothrix obliqua TaxID=2861747 RepID=UPI001C5E65FC|nr:cytochrome P450 [Saccharothrix obliqua]MBW4721880.1 cytochrome P450 [Saccharothrix obliqua]
MQQDLQSTEFLFAGASQRHAGNARLHARGPVHQVTLPSGGEAWLVTGYEAARRALADPRLRGRTGAVGDRRRLSAETDLGMNTHMLNLEPPDHTRLRRLVSAPFTHHRTAALRGDVQRITDRLLDDLADRDEVDLVEEFALPLPIRVLTRLLGVPAEDTDAFHRWTALLTASGVPLAELDETALRMLAYVRELLAEKRRAPGDDLLSELCALRDGQDRLEEHELTSMVFLLLIAGHETTVNLIGNGLLAVLSDPELAARAREGEDAVATVVEEVLRHESPVQAAMRISTEEVDLAGVTIPAGAVVIVSLLAANRDPARFTGADRFDPARPDNQHLAFGHGIHHCLGAPLARLEGRIALHSLLTRFPRLRLARPQEEPVWRRSLIMHGLAGLPARTR